MIEPQVEHGGASSWFWIAANCGFLACVATTALGRSSAPGHRQPGHVEHELLGRRGFLAVVHAGAVLRFGRQELRRQPPEDVVDDRLREADVRVLRHARRLEADVAELVDEILQRHAVLQRVADRLRERVGEARDRRAFLRHRQEQLAGLAVLVEADGDVALVAGDVELVRDRLPLVGQPVTARRGFGAVGAGRDGLLVLRRVERLRALAAVAVDRHGLRADPPRVDVGLLDLLDRRGLRHVDGLARSRPR